MKAAVRSAESCLHLPNVENIIFDYEIPDTYETAVANVDSVFIQAPPLDPLAYEKISPFIDFLASKGIKRVVFNSAWGVDHNEEVPLRKIERKLMNDNFEYTITRPNFFIENFTSGFASAPLNNDGVIVHNAGDSKLAFVSIQDIASVVVAAFEGDTHIGKAYNLSGKEPLSHGEVATLFSAKTGKEVQNIALTTDQMKAGAMENRLPESAASHLKDTWHTNQTISFPYLGKNPKHFRTYLGKTTILQNSIPTIKNDRRYRKFSIKTKRQSFFVPSLCFHSHTPESPNQNFYDPSCSFF